MSLTNCQQCKFFDRSPYHQSDIVCGLNPAYASMWKRLTPLDEYSLGCLPIDSCGEFEVDPNLKEKTIALNLTLEDWRRLVRESNSTSVAKTLNTNLFELEITLNRQQWQGLANSTSIANLKLALSNEGIKPTEKDNSWIEVDSSCINAIAFNGTTNVLSIRFRSGLVYEYYDFDRFKFSDFRNASSHGRFFNSQIKDVYRYRQL